MKPATAEKQNLLTLHEQFKVENNCNAYCATSRLTVSAEQNEQGIATTTGHWEALEQCFSTVGPRPGTGPCHQLYRAARGSAGICHFSFLSNFH